MDAAGDAAQRANSMIEMHVALQDERFHDPFVYEGLWYAAAFLSLEDDFQRDEQLQARVLKMFVFATLLELSAEQRMWPREEQLFGMGPVSLQALNDRTGMAPPGSPRESLFLRMPEFSESRPNGFYHYIQLDLHAYGKKVVSERSDPPWLGLEADYTVTRVESLPANDFDRLAAEGLSYSFPLQVMNHFIIAAKAYACLSLIGTDSPYTKYANVIIANSFFGASSVAGGGHSAIGMSRAAVFPMKSAVDEFRRAPSKFGHLLRASSLEPRLTSMNFFGRRLHSAATLYNRAVEADGGAGYRLYGLFGSAMTAVGLGDDTTVVSRLNAVLEALEDESGAYDDYRYIVVALYDTFDKHGAVGRTLDVRRELIEGWRGVSVDERRRYRLNLDVARILWTIGRFDEVATLWIREIGRLQSSDVTGIEGHYLRELGATTRDLFTLLSWRIDFDGGSFVPATDQEVIWLKDFAPTWMDRVLRRGGGWPYGAVSPDEDEVTCLEAYNVGTKLRKLAHELARTMEEALGPQELVDGAGEWASRVYSELVLQESVDKGASRVNTDLVQWAREEQYRHNYEPLLKLAWVEWFWLPLISLPHADLDSGSWVYRVSTVDDVATRQAVQKVAASRESGVDPTTRQVAKTFLMVRRFLGSRYAG